MRSNELTLRVFTGENDLFILINKIYSRKKVVY